MKLSDSIERYRYAWCGMLAVFFLACSWNAGATAPRVAPQLFGEELKPDIVGYRFTPANQAGSDDELLHALVTEAFKAAGANATLDILPSRQLAKYALLNNDAVALLGNERDLSVKEKNQYRMVAFYLRGNAADAEAITLMFNRKNVRGNSLRQAFDSGLQKLIKSGRYAELVKKHLGKGQLSSDYVSRLKRRNPGWK